MKKITAFFVAIFFGVSLFFQISKAYADPVILPITSPLTFFAITGNVTYKNLGKFFSLLSHTSPAEDVTVVATNFFDSSKTFSTQTDGSGNYVLPVEPGLYQVEASDSSNTFFVPPQRVVNARNRNRVANFRGLIFP